jgi:hypothetical protein
MAAIKGVHLLQATLLPMLDSCAAQHDRGAFASCFVPLRSNAYVA